MAKTKRKIASPKVSDQTTIELPCPHGTYLKGAASYSRDVLYFRCVHCKAMVKRSATEKEKKQLKKFEKKQHERTAYTNGPYWEFADTFKDQSPGSWKLSGYELMNAIEIWAEKWNTDPDKQRVLFGYCDDNHFTSSMIVFITGDEPDGGYWGTHVVVISQCDGDPPKEFFLYPGHANSVLDVMVELGKRARKPTKQRWPFKNSRFEDGR